MVGRWNWDEPTLRLTKEDREHLRPLPPEFIQQEHIRRPSPAKIAAFLRVIRLMNDDQEPDPDGPLGDVWAWLRKLAISA